MLNKASDNRLRTAHGLKNSHRARYFRLGKYPIAVYAFLYVVGPLSRSLSAVSLLSTYIHRFNGSISREKFENHWVGKMSKPIKMKFSDGK